MNERIKELRKFFGINQTEFGNMIGVKQGSIASYESGARTPLNSVILSICREFNVNEKWLRTGEGEMFVPPEDETAEYVSMFLEESNPFFDLILYTMKAFKKQDRTGKEALYKISADILEEIKKGSD